MRIDVNTSEKYIDIWLLRGENPPDCSEIKKCFPKYDIVIWRSGHEDFISLTAALLKNNR